MSFILKCNCNTLVTKGGSTMDQKKTGSFLRELRMEKGLTQAELAEQLNTTNRSVSRWETGSTMPDISILVELAEFYQVDIKEIIDGERQSEKMDADVKETVEKVAEYSKTTGRKKTAKVILIMSLPIIVLSVLLIILFSTRSMQVVPDTYPVYQQVYIDEKITDNIITKYVIDHMPIGEGNSKSFANIAVFSAEEKQNGDYYVYTWVLESVYSYEGGMLSAGSGSSYPCRFELIRENDGFRIVNADIPRDGNYYLEDIKKLFPGYVVDMITNVHQDGTVDRLTDKTLADAKTYFTDA